MCASWPGAVAVRRLAQWRTTSCCVRGRSWRSDWPRWRRGARTCRLWLLGVGFEVAGLRQTQKPSPSLRDEFARQRAYLLEKVFRDQARIRAQQEAELKRTLDKQAARQGMRVTWR